MSKIIDNITLGIISLKQALETYLDANQWNKKYSMYLAGDEELRGKEIVLKATDSRKQIALPVAILETGYVRNGSEELGDIYGKDFVAISILVKGYDDNQSRTLGNLLRRKMTDLVFDVYDYRNPRRVNVGSALLTNVTLDSMVDWNADDVSDRFQSLINATMEITAQELI